MTPICSEHAALLRRIAKHPEDNTACKVYADWLQERGEIGWLIVAHYHPYSWPVRYDSKGLLMVTTYNGGSSHFDRWYGVPWLEGKVLIRPFQNFKIATGWILKAYAEGKAK